MQAGAVRPADVVLYWHEATISVLPEVFCGWQVSTEHRAGRVLLYG